MSETGHASVTPHIIAQSFGFKQLLEDLDQRAMGRAYRIIGRDLRPQSTGGFMVQPESVGDPTGMFLWIPVAPSGSLLTVPSRPLSTWRHAYPVLTAIGAGGRVNIPRGGNGPVDEIFLSSAGDDDTQAFPVFNEAWAKDTRMAYELPSFHPCWPKIPGGAAGIILDTMQEDRQRALFFHADPRLIAVNYAGSPDYSSRVFDLNDENEFDCQRWAPLHSMMRVVLMPDDNWLAWQIGDTGKGEPLTGRGAMYEKIRGTGLVGLAGWIEAGPINAGIIGDKHQLGTTDDGEQIAPGHISTEAYYVTRTEVGFPVGVGAPILDHPDGPLEFHLDLYSRPPMGPYRVPVFLNWDPDEPHAFRSVTGGDQTRDGKYRWESYTYWAEFDPPVIETPGGDEGPPVREEPPAIGNGKFLPYDHSEKVPQRHVGTGLIPMQPGFLIQAPLTYTPDEEDLRNNMSPKDVSALKNRAPAVMREEGFYKSNNGGDPVYTNPPGNSRYPSGTACGGSVVMPPESDILDYVDLDDAGGATNKTPIHTESDVTRIYAPNTGIGFGLPPIPGQGCNLRKGIDLRGTTTEGLRAKHIDVDGNETTILDIDEDYVQIYRGLKLPYEIISADETVDLVNFNKMVLTGASDITLTLPSAVTNDGYVINIKTYFGNTKNVIVAAFGGETIDGSASYTLINDETTSLQAIGALDMWTIW